MKNYLEARKDERGFTLMEMLIVVAIIAVLIAIAIPIFTSQLEKSREAADAANIRSAYAEVMVAAIDDTDTATTKQVKLSQTNTGWQNTDIETGLKKVFNVDGYSCDSVISQVGDGKTATVAWAAPTGTTTGHATIAIS